MTLLALLDLVKKITNALKGVFPTKEQVSTDIETAKTALKAYADTKVSEGVNGSASTTYVDDKVALLNSMIATFQGGLDDKIDTKVATLGTFVGVSNKYASLPVKDQNNKAITAGDFAHLTAKDGAKKKGLYRYDGTEYVFISGDPAVVEILASLKYESIDDTNDDKFITGKYLKDREDANTVTQAQVDEAVANA